MKYITYLRISTNETKQVYGIDAQRATVMAHIKANDGELVAEFIDHESGRKTSIEDRPQLHDAMALVKSTPDCKLLLAKTDRVARDLHFISGLLKDNVPLIVAGHEHMTKLEWHMHAMIAEHEADMISQRTKLALEQAKERGVILGAPRDQIQRISKLGGIATHNKARQYREKIMPLINQLLNDPQYLRRGNKHTPHLEKMADRLNELGMRSAHNKRITKSTIYALLNRK
ncbi:recombinase family protein [Methylophilales phage MEP301]|nr:recombinase family protein [Methylophilales phage MEP301]